MPPKIEPLAIPDLTLITPARFVDARGFVSETFNAADLRSAGIDMVFVQDNHSLSTVKGTVRGLHFQTAPFAQAKLVRVSRGRILDVAVDLRRNSATFGRHVAVELSAETWAQMFVPVGFAHGFCILEPDTEVLYKMSAPYAPASEAGIKWNDPALGIAWPDFAGAQVSGKDAVLPCLSEIDSPFG
jgi:dTDP-4-dehydrorhamnose 3,5-epimerase